MSTSWCIMFTPSILFVHRFWLKRSDWQDEPDNWKGEDPSGENCALYTKQGDWLDHSCKKLHTFVCETVATSRVCPDGWAHNSGKCYLFSSTGKTLKQSRDHCITLGGHLVIVNNQEEILRFEHERLWGKITLMATVSMSGAKVSLGIPRAIY